MAYELVILPIAKREIEEAIGWYESKQKGMGIDFLNYLDGYFLVLKEGNVDFQIKRSPFFREFPLKKFPYVIIYELIGFKIVVYSVFNTYQNPIKKMK